MVTILMVSIIRHQHRCSLIRYKLYLADVWFKRHCRQNSRIVTNCKSPTSQCHWHDCGLFKLVFFLRTNKKVLYRQWKNVVQCAKRKIQLWWHQKIWFNRHFLSYFKILFKLKLSLKKFQRVKVKSQENEIGLRERASDLPKILVNVHYDFQTKRWVDGETNEEIPEHLWRGHNATGTAVFPKQPFTPLYITAGLAFLQKNTSKHYSEIPRWVL